MQIPPVIRAPWIITSIPRRWDFEHSDCHVGTVDVFRPLPKPVMILAVMNCARENELHCRIAPTIIIDDPRKMVFRRPSRSPLKMVAIAPQKQPRLYAPTAMPCMVLRWVCSATVVSPAAASPAGVVSISGNTATKEGRVRRPPITP